MNNLKTTAMKKIISLCTNLETGNVQLKLRNGENGEIENASFNLLESRNATWSSEDFQKLFKGMSIDSRCMLSLMVNDYYAL